MRIGVLGPGVIGTAIGVRLAARGHEVTFIGRGARLAQLQEHGARLVDDKTGRAIVATTEVRGALGPRFDWLLCAVRAHAVTAALEAIAADDTSDNVLTLTNHALGVSAWTDIIGPRLAFGFPGISGALDDSGVVRHRIAPRRVQPSPLGEASGERSARVIDLAAAFCNAGIPSVVHPRIDDWLRAHVAWIHVLGLAIANTGGDAERLIADRALREAHITAIFECLDVAAAHGPLTPSGLRWLRRCPRGALSALVKRVLARPEVRAAFADGGAGQRLENAELVRQMRVLAAQVGHEMPAHRGLSEERD